MKTVARGKSKPAHAHSISRARAHDQKIVRTNIANHKRLALAIVEAVKLDPYIQFEIVSDWCKRHGLVLASKADADARARMLLADLPAAAHRKA